jgi:hypothetical protein
MGYGHRMMGDWLASGAYASILHARACDKNVFTQLAASSRAHSSESIRGVPEFVISRLGPWTNGSPSEFHQAA